MADASAPPPPLPPAAYSEVFLAAPVALLVLRTTDHVVVEANPAFLAQVGRDHDEVVGHDLLDLFPDSPLQTADQAAGLEALLRRTGETGEPQTRDAARYDIPDGDGGFVPRWWRLAQAPLPGPSGGVDHLVECIEDVTELHLAREALHAHEASRFTRDRQVAGLAEVALALTTAETVSDLEEIVIARGVGVLDADGGAVLTRGPHGDWEATVAPGPDGSMESVHMTLPFDSPLPAAVAARTQSRVLLANRAEGLAFHPEMADVYARRGRDAWAFLPMMVGGETIGTLAIAWKDEHPFDAAEVEVMEGFAAQCAQTLSRLQASEARRRTARRVQELAESLQRSMLTAPPRPERVDIAVRYRSAMDVAQVGGDWYDAFQHPDGSTVLCIGDVCGHDAAAAGKMGQIRGLLRALAYDSGQGTRDGSPAAVLTRFEYAARGLHVDELATAVLARVEATSATAGRSPGWRLTWSNAGNTPPLLLLPGGDTQVLDPRPDLLLGVDPSTDRHDHTVDLPDDAVLLLYTDGLVERRGSSIDRGMSYLREALAGLAGLPLEDLCDALLRRLTPYLGEDDIAMLAVRPRAHR